MSGKGLIKLPEASLFEAAAISVARKAGELLMAMQNQDRQIRFKGEVDLVTDADMASERLVIEALTKEFPDHEIVAEEGSGKAAVSDFKWLIDPLDGTTNYAHRFPVYCISIALQFQAKIIMGVIYNPVLDELFTARLGNGAYLNNHKLKVSEESRLMNGLLATGFPYDIRENCRNNLGHFGEFAKKAQGIRRAGSAALDLAYVACGRLDGFWEMKLKPWDIAAGMLLVVEAGGRVSDFQGGGLNLDDGDIVASNGLIHQEMLEVIGCLD